MKKEEINKYKKELEKKTPEEVIAWTLDYFDPKNAALASSMGAEDQVITDMLIKIDPTVNIFTLETGRLPEETFQTIAATNKHYETNIELLHPDAKAVEKMVKEHGEDLFYDSIEKRKICCNIRKVEPLKKKLKTFKVWFCGLRRDQAPTRIGLEVIEWDNKFEVVKINPIVEWSEKEVWDYIKKDNVPYNKLHDQRYPSIGCAPCTRAIKPGEDIRAGRWWWENPENKECGLHLKDDE